MLLYTCLMGSTVSAIFRVWIPEQLTLFQAIFAVEHVADIHAQ